jgi:hypothetical protein
MHTCMFCGQEIRTALISYSYFIPMGEDDPMRGTGHAHVECIQEFEQMQFDYEQIAADLIQAWEKRLTQLYMN